MKTELSLVDPWRIQHEDSKAFTWSCKTPLKRARLDFYLISEELMARVDITDIKQGYRTDHNICEIELKFTNFQKQSGFWIFNNTLLRDQIYVEKVKQIILDMKCEFAASPYNRTTLQHMDIDDIVFMIDDQSFFELLLLRIRGATIPYSSHTKKRKKMPGKGNLRT